MEFIVRACVSVSIVGAYALIASATSGHSTSEVVELVGYAMGGAFTALWLRRP